MLEGLNQEQLMAVKATLGPVMVFAGAGSGKTRTLTCRIIHMIKNEKINPFNILAITFTNKATNEMRERLNAYLDIDVKNITICTFHALCAKILRREIDVLGYSNSFTIIDEEDQLKVISDLLKENDYDRKQAKHIQRQISNAKCFNMKPDEPFANLMFIKYEERMKQLNMLDFEDLLLKVYEIFSNHKEILNKYQEKFKYVLVDEFQDTNLMQYKIIRMIAVRHQNIFVVGDDDQSIYSFRGANYENMQLFKEDFPTYQLYTLTQNYRSTQSILNYSNRLIKNNKNREGKELFSTNPGDIDNVVVYQAIDERDEVDYVVETLKSLKSANNSYKDFAILYRSSVILRNFELGLIRQNVPYKVYGGLSYLRRREVKDIIAYFKLMISDYDLLSFKRVINVPGRGIGSTTVEKIETLRKEKHLSVFEAIDWSKEVLTKTKHAEVNAFKELILKYREKLNDVDLITIFELLVEEIGYIEYLKKESETVDEFNDRKANLNEFKSILWAVENSGDIGTDRFNRLKDAFDSAILSDEYLQNQKENPNGVTVSTIHSVKGLEFKYVFLVGFEENIFPNNFRVESDKDIEEERRIAYVALTRAKEKLFMTCAHKRLLYGSFVKNEPSRFLLEACGTQSFSKNNYYSDENQFIDDYKHNDNQYIDVKPVLVDEPKKKIDASFGAKSESGYVISDVVIHKTFGEGIIIDISNGIGSVFFNEDKKIRKLLLDHPALRKK